MKQSILLGFILLEASICSAQEILSSQGQDDVLSDVHISWTLGELAIGELGAISQGFHQPIIEIIPLGVNDESLLVAVYPNPTADQFIVKTIDQEEPFTYSLTSLSGHLILEGEQKGASLNVNLSRHPSGIYILRITQGQIIKSFKIIKSK